MIAIAAAIACRGNPPPVTSATGTAPRATARAAELRSPGDAARLDQDLPRLVDRALAMYQDLAGALAASQRDCGAAVARLRELAGTYREVARANARVAADGRDGALAAALEPHREDFERSAQAIVHSATVSRCSVDPAFAEAFTKAFDELLEAPP